MEQLFVEHALGASEDLFFLAEFYYGNAGLWWVIYHANVEVIGDDPEDLAPGTALRVPLLAVKRQRMDMPAYIPATPYEASKDPLIHLCEDRYGDAALYFDLLEISGLEGDEVLAPGTRLTLPPRGNPYDLKKAESYREKFYSARSNY